MTGRLGDMYGKRRMLLISLMMLVAGSVTAALSGSLARRGVRLLRPGHRRVHGHRDRLPAPGVVTDGPGQRR
jgi:MFS family permease